MPAEQGDPHRLAAVVALASAVVLAILGIDIVLSQFPRGLIVLACLGIAFASAWYGLTRTGAARLLGSGMAILAATVAVTVLIADGDHIAQALVVVVGLGLMVLATRSAFRIPALLDPAPDPRRPVLFYNPKSGGGKAEKFHLADEARARGIEPIELKPGTDLEQLVRGAVADGADALAMAGGDGSQAVVAMVAAGQGLPYACIPAGTRNHFALDLGVDRDDVIGALDAFVGGRERRVDLAEVNGRVFVNNVSIGLYAEAVQREGYREAKLRTILDTLPEVLGPEGEGLDLRWTEPGGHGHSSGAAILVSNNRYRLGRVVGSGTRPRIDDGLLGIAAGCGSAPLPAALARVVHARVRGRRRRPDRRRDRRRGRNSGRPAALQNPAGGAVGSDRRRTPRSLPVRGDARGRLGDRSRAGTDRRTGNAETPGSIVPMSEWLNEAKAVDSAVYGAIAAAETPSLDIAMRGLSRAADHSKLWFAAAAASAVLGGPSGRLAARKGLVSLGIASASANLVAKPLTTRRRPARKEAEELARRHVQMPRSSSFPSGHAASAFAFATGAANAQPMLSAPLRALATLVGYSRVHTGVHYPADVLAGAFIGVSAAELAGHLLDR